MDYVEYSAQKNYKDTLSLISSMKKNLSFCIEDLQKGCKDKELYCKIKYYETEILKYEERVKEYENNNGDEIQNMINEISEKYKITNKEEMPKKERKYTLFSLFWE
jgi:hypothetical protein